MKQFDGQVKVSPGDLLYSGTIRIFIQTFFLQQQAGVQSENSNTEKEKKVAEWMWNFQPIAGFMYIWGESANVF